MCYHDLGLEGQTDLSLSPGSVCALGPGNFDGEP